ncbi:MAG: hypothetical protein ACREPX_04125, partial [Rhodanobacteraceae bacterium]
LQARADRADQWEHIIKESTAKPDQLTSALGYLQAINSGDPAKMGKAFDVMLDEIKWLGEQCGRDLPGLVDPLKNHADLVKQVEEGDITRTAALEIARHRTESKRNTERSTQQQTEQQARDEHKKVVDKAIADIDKVNARLKAGDAQFAQKLPLMADAIKFAREKLHPTQWAEYLEHAYSQIKIQPVVPPTVKPGPMPLRSTGSAGVQQRQPKNAMEAFEMGVDSER